MLSWCKRLEILSRFTKKEKNKFLRGGLVLSILIVLFLTYGSFRRIVILSVFLAANFLTALIKRKIPTLFIRKYFFGIEFVLFSAVITSISYGPYVGAAMGAMSILANYIAEKRISKYILPTFILYITIGYSSFYFQNIGIITLGITISLIYNILSFISAKLIGANTTTLLVFNIVNILFNIFLFTSFAIPVLKII